jgi:prepilin-type N-terminal cleavage/methylation domain-containing protein
VNGGRQARCRHGGFTLVEVLVTIVLMGIVLPITMRAVTNALTAASHARHTAEASALAEAKLNEIVASGNPTTFGTSGDFGAEWPEYQWTCQSVTDSNGFTQISLVVTWREGNRERTYNLSTLVWG